jgi:competence protein ComEC
MTLHFYDVGQALAVLVDLPDGRHLLVDAGDEPHRSGCGDACERANAHLLDSLRRDLRGAPLDLLWITHQHSDHVGGAPGVLRAFSVGAYVDNGRDPGKGEVRRAHRAAEERNVTAIAIVPGQSPPRLLASDLFRLTPILPSAWPASCARDANECSIALRIDYSASSVLFTGDAEHEEEAMLDARGPVTLLQVAHHGSETSTSPAFLSRARPRYAVVSAGKPGEGTNREYCHPRALVVRRLSRVLGGDAGAHRGELEAFDGDRCDRAQPSDWVRVPASDRLWSTSRDGDVVLRTTGDGTFERVAPPEGSAQGDFRMK